MTSNPVGKKRTQGWKELQSMLQGVRIGHGCCEIYEHCMIILGGWDDDCNVLSSGFIYDARTKQTSPLPNDIPEARCDFVALANERYMFVIGGRDADDRASVNTVYRLSLETYQWTTMAPMGTARAGFAGVLLGDYVYMFGGYNDDLSLASVERYSIVGNTWEDLPDMAEAHDGHCTVAALRNVIYILGGVTRVIEVFDTTLLEWRSEARLCDMPAMRIHAATVVLKNRYLVVIGGKGCVWDTSGCLIYDCSINQWSTTPAAMNMITARHGHNAAVLDGKIVVAGGDNGRGRCLSSMECINARDILQYAPLDYPLPVEYFNHILQLGKALLVS